MGPNLYLMFSKYIYWKNLNYLKWPHLNRLKNRLPYLKDIGSDSDFALKKIKTELIQFVIYSRLNFTNTVIKVIQSTMRHLCVVTT